MDSNQLKIIYKREKVISREGSEKRGLSIVYMKVEEGRKALWLREIELLALY